MFNILVSKAVFLSAVLSAQINIDSKLCGFRNVRAEITVNDCSTGKNLNYQTNYYKYTKEGLKFLDEKKGEIVFIEMNDGVDLMLIEKTTK